jgi:hypothetical protein
MLKYTDVKLELMTDIDQVMFVESNIRGGLSYIGQRFCKKTPENEMLYIDGMYMHKIFVIGYFAMQNRKQKRMLISQNLLTNRKIKWEKV